MATSNTESVDSNTCLSPLEVKSIEHIYKSSDAPTSENFVDCYYVTGNSHVGADEWFTTSTHKPFRIRFPAHINRHYKDSKISSYGNNTDTGKIDLKALKKLKVIFALDPVTDRPDHISNKAPFVMHTLHYIQQAYDDTLNHGLNENSYPRVHSFTRRDDEGNYYILVNPDSIFKNVPFASSGSPVKLDKSSIGSGLSTTNGPITSTSGHAFRAKTPPLNPEDLTLAHMPDPSNRFSSIRWHIRGDSGNPNGSRAYQLILHKMQLILTSTDSTHALLTSSSPELHCLSADDPFIVDGHISDWSLSTVTTGSPNLDKTGVSISSQPTMHSFTPTGDIDTTPTASTSTILGPSTSTPSYSKITASLSMSKKRPANNMEKTSNIPKNPRIGKDKNA
ncbi:hypothetical protein K439DRAFT_1532322 [Ramaria rubella]|nr:hypothetical protein K439DRAFT_1532322 [Ramaria rubella]